MKEVLDKSGIIAATAAHVRQLLQGEGSGHDWWHILRVWNCAKKIASTEEADLFVIELAALLHDIGDHKFHNGNETVGPQLATAWLNQFDLQAGIVEDVVTIIQEVSYKGAGTSSAMSSMEGCIVQDADRLDAIGAIGIARAFAYGGYKNRELYDPVVKPEMHTTFESYKSTTAPTINHFYEKLLLLKDRMHTRTARKIADERHLYMEQYLEHFFAEWEGSK